MPLLGEGLLAIWNDIAPEAEAAFAEWHVREHIPERVGVAGFLRGRRYAAVEGTPKYFNFYETRTPDTLRSAAYIERLNAPSDWTKRVVAHFKNTSRTICAVTRSFGIGGGAHIATFRATSGMAPARFAANIARVLGDAMAAPGIVGAHLAAGEAPPPGAPTAEMKLRGGTDATIGWLIMVEAVGVDALFAACDAVLQAPFLQDAGVERFERGVYSLQYTLSAEELRQTVPTR